jgi:uncharacterized protein (DUF736 family)
MEETQKKAGDRPDFRLCQVVQKLDAEGKSVNDYKSVGGVWKNKSKNGNVFYRVRIGTLELLMFPNDKPPEGKQQQIR